MELFTKYLQDPRTKGFWLLGSPLYPIVIVAVYLAFNLKIGPDFMKNRRPFKLRTFMTFVNILQVISNIYYILRSIPTMKTMSLICAVLPSDTTPETLESIKMTYLYLLLKIADLVDTCVFTLRKKQSQVTFLHLYHHIGMIFAVWIPCNYFPGGVPGWSAWLNCIAHAFMYSYYLISSWTRVDNKWKKMITRIQITHHWVILASFIAVLVNPNCAYSKTYSFGMVLFMVPMIALFLNFYMKSYLKKSDA